MPHATELEDPETEVLLYEFRADLEAYLAALGGEAPRTLAELIQFNEEHRDEEMPLFGQELFLQANEKGRSRIPPTSRRSPRAAGSRAPRASTP